MLLLLFPLQSQWPTPPPSARCHLMDAQTKSLVSTAPAPAAPADFPRRPQSAGAHPGPVCYRKSGHLAVTDANVFLGRVIPKYFPKIFGPGEVRVVSAQ